MSTLNEIKEAVSRFSPEDLAAFRAWFVDWDADMWKKIEGGAKAGRLSPRLLEILETLRDMEGQQDAIVKKVRKRLLEEYWADEIDLESQGIDEAQAQVLRSSLLSFSEDWDSPEMSIYDNYDAAKAKEDISQVASLRPTLALANMDTVLEILPELD